MFQNDSGAFSEINPHPLRVIATMGDIEIKDWFIFFGSIIVALPFYFFVTGTNLSGILFSSVPQNMLGIIDLLFISPIVGFGACLAFIQTPQNGKFRTRFIRWLKFVHQPKVFSPEEMASLYCIKETRENHVHYKNFDIDGVFSVYRIEGYDPSLLEQSRFADITENLANFFGINIRFKLLSLRVSFAIPEKTIKNQKDHYGINFAINRYQLRIQDLNNSEEMKESAYFLIIDGVSIEKNIQAAGLIHEAISAAHMGFQAATPIELSQVLAEIWCDGFSYAHPAVSGIKSITFDKNSVIYTKKDGTVDYVRYLGFHAIPENATASWLAQMMNNPNFTLLMDISPMDGKVANKYLEDTSNAADGIIQTKWFKKRASDVERQKIAHLHDVTQIIIDALTTGQVQLKEVCFYLIFRDKTKKRVNQKVNDVREKLATFNSGWMLTECQFLQKQAVINTRLHDIPSLQYHKKSLSLLKTGKMSSSGARTATQSYTNNLEILQAVDHKILTTALGLSYPFTNRITSATPETWFKGFIIDSDDNTPFFNYYWKIDQDYNSFNRFYQGRNGSGKTYTANIDVVSDRLDDKFLIMIDPKPERVTLTKNLGGENLNIGGTDPADPHINIFDVLHTPENKGENKAKNENPLLTQYQSNLLNIGILLSLDANKPDDKIVLSCFNDIQQIVYEDIYKITPDLDFSKFPKNKFPLMKDMYDEALRQYNLTNVPETKTAFNKLVILMKEHAVGVSAPIFNFHTNVDWSSNRMWNLIVRDISINYGNKSILACWVLNLIRIAEAFMMSGQEVALYIDELHLIHNIDGVLGKLDEFARIDRSFRAAVCLINQNFNSIRSTADAKKREYYESLFTMSQYNFFFTTGEEDVAFLVDMLSGSGSPLTGAERSFITRAGRGKSLLVMTAYDRFRVQFDISFWREMWETDLEEQFKTAASAEAEEQAAAKSEVDPIQEEIMADKIDIGTDYVDEEIRNETTIAAPTHRGQKHQENPINVIASALNVNKPAPAAPKPTDHGEQQ